ncbi:MAG: hypothetical protein M1383_05945 [Patescibacteria group bacterium]|nr:hypothetical protein [Patescibacteria group bacterium]
MLKNIFTTKFLFQINTVSLEKTDSLFLYIGAILTVLAIVFKLAEKFAPTPIDRKYRGKFFNLLLTIGLCELVWYGARLQNVRFFGTHFVALLVLLIGVAWLVSLVIKMAKNYGVEKDRWEKEQVREKYLPK